MRKMQLLGILFGMMMSLPAWATGIATVDFQKALTMVEEGKRTETELNTLMNQKQGEVQQLQMQLQNQMQQYQQQQALLHFLCGTRTSASFQCCKYEQTFLD